MDKVDELKERIAKLEYEKRVAELELKVAQLEAEIAALKARPVYVQAPYWYCWPPYREYPMITYTDTTCSTDTIDFSKITVRNAAR
jgi:hypothetical protein